MRFLKFILLLLSLYSTNCFSQDCSRFDRWAECRPRIKDYNTYLQPKSIPVGINDKVRFTVFFEGNSDYILSFCANRIYYPINVRLLKLESREEIYNNASGNYSESIGVGISKTQSLVVEVSLLAYQLGTEKLKRNDVVCVGMIIHYQKILNN